MCVQVSKACVCRYLGVMSTLVSLHTGLGGVGSAAHTLDTAVEYWRSRDEAVHRQLMLEAGKYKLVHCGPQDAVTVLEQLHKQLPKDIRVSHVTCM